jgi:RHS repeat-associated protein
VLDHTNGVVVSFVRGLDLSGSIQGAGGVGGVLAVQAGTSAQCGPVANTTHFTCYDGNGNVTALVNAATGAESARYEYGPFAEPIRMTGVMARVNPIRFSTQYADDVTGDTKYLFRDLRDGRWPNRDPIAEDGGLNIYAFVGNNPMKYVDPDGQQFYEPPIMPPIKPRGAVSCGGVCGAIIDDWIIDEINAQIAGWDAWKKANPGKDKIGNYIPWANGNQRYKDPNFFQFNKDAYPTCATEEGEKGCGRSVTLCGQCVRSSILGNIIYGIIGNYAGFSDAELNTASVWKRRVGIPVDQYDEEAYGLGAQLKGNANIGDFCKKFNEKKGTALREGRSLAEGGGYNDLSTCRPCSLKTTATNHGGNSPPRWMR